MPSRLMWAAIFSPFGLFFFFSLFNPLFLFDSVIFNGIICYWWNFSWALKFFFTTHHGFRFSGSLLTLLSCSFPLTVFCFQSWFLLPWGILSLSLITYTWHVQCCAWSLSRVRLLVIPRTVAARLLCPWGFSRQEYWSGCHALPQGVFLIRGKLNQCFLHCKWILYHLNHQGSPHMK